MSNPLTWPPTLADLKNDMKIPLDDTRDDVILTQVLDAAIDKVTEIKAGVYDFGVAPDLPVPPVRIVLGTIRLAGRWHTRRRSPDGLVAMAELGAARVPSFDPDIERMLGIGRYAASVFA